MRERPGSIPYGFAWQSGCAHGLHGRRNGLQDAPEFRCIPPTNILRTCLHVRIKFIQMAERRIGRVSKTNACLSAIQNGSRARGAVSGLNFQRSHVAPAVRFGEQRSARASTRPSTTGSAGTQAIRPCASACGGPFQPKRVLPNHVAPAQWCLSCVHTQARFSCKKLRNPLHKVPHKDVDLWKNCRGNAGEVARVLWVPLFGVTHKLVQRKSRAVKSHTEPIAMTACDLLTQWSINVDCVTVCVAVVRQLHGLLNAGRLYTPTA